MLENRRLRSILLIYVALFINLGPSLHRAPIFGLHGDEAVASCCCGCSHARPDANDDQNLKIEKPECACQLCHFFKYMQADVVETTADSNVTESSRLYLCLTAQSSKMTVSNSARGPPVG